MLHGGYLSSMHHVSGTGFNINIVTLINICVHSTTKFSKMLKKEGHCSVWKDEFPGKDDTLTALPANEG